MLELFKGKLIRSFDQGHFMFANLRDRNSIDGGSSVHTAEVNAHDAEEGSLGHKSTSPLGMPYFHELKEI